MRIIGAPGDRHITMDGVTVTPHRSQKVRNHSPDGFSWGYEGSGPAQLALAILLEVTTRDRAQRHYQQFKRQFIAPLPFGRPFDTTIDIEQWLTEQEKAR